MPAPANTPQPVSYTHLDVYKRQIECRVKEIMSLGSHDMFIADVVNVRADDRNLNTETGKLELAEANPLVYVHGGYYELGEKIGKFGWSVEKKR